MMTPARQHGPPAISSGAIFLPCRPVAAVLHVCTLLVLWHWRPRAACLGYGGTLLQLPCGMSKGSCVRSFRSCGLQMKGLVQGAALQQPLEHLQLQRRIGRLPVSLEGQMPQVRVIRVLCVAVAAQAVGSWCSGAAGVAMQLLCS